MAVIGLGIDWGTHSSKWSAFDSRSRRFHDRSPLFSSYVVRRDGALVFGPPRETVPEEILSRSLKRLLIQDPLGQSFWDSVRLDTDTSLGEAVAFCLTALLVDARRTLADPDVTRAAELGFSLPNWLVDDDPASRAAAFSFCEAVRVSVSLWSRNMDSDLPKPGEPFEAARWRQLVATTRASLGPTTSNTLTIQNMTNLEFGARDGHMWRFLAESGAAGLPYLRASELPGEAEEAPGVSGLRKILVVDVGAGSTDVGYMLRVVHRENRNQTLYYFPPASSFPEAGNVLTEELVRYSRAQGQRRTFLEAEAVKMRDGEWHQLPFVKSWVERIAQHVGDYVRGVPDQRWLPEAVTLRLVITGGSGLVPGLRERVTEIVSEALVARGSSTRASTMIRSVEPLRFGPRLEQAAAYAQRAVCFGAADLDKPGLRFMDAMDKPVRSVTVQPRSWV